MILMTNEKPDISKEKKYLKDIDYIYQFHTSSLTEYISSVELLIISL